MRSLKEALMWLLKNKLILAFIVYTILFCWAMVITYRFVDEMLSIAQRGYFFSVPKLPFRGQKLPLDSQGLRCLTSKERCTTSPTEPLPSNHSRDEK